MANPVTELLEHINHEVSKLSTVGLTRLTEVLDAAELELTRALASWSALGRGDDRFTPQMYRNSLVQIRGALEKIRGPLAEGVASAMRHGGMLAAHLATGHLINQVTTWSAMFEGTIRPIAIEAASVLAEGKKLVWPRFSNSAKRYAGQVGEDIRKQLAIGVVRGETVDQLTSRLSKLGGPSGLVYTRGQEGSPRAKAEFISEGLFRRYRHFAERLVVTETVNAYNSFALEGMDELEKEDPGYFKRWDAALDKRTCPFCGGYDDNVVPLDKTFKGGVNHPPLHPRCRCAVVIWRKEWNEASYKDDLLKETKGIAPTGVASIPHQIDLPKQKKEPKPKKETKKQIAEREKQASEARRAESLRLLDEQDKERKKFTDLQKAITSQCTEAQLEAARSYTGPGYVPINTYARTGKVPYSNLNLEDVKKHTKHLDEIVRMHKAQVDTTIYRGMYAPEIVNNLQPGSILSDKGFVSTSNSESSTTRFTRGPNWETEGSAVFHIKVPKGSHLTPIPSTLMEDEYLLPRESKFKIIKVEEGIGTKTKTIYAELVE